MPLRRVDLPLVFPFAEKHVIGSNFTGLTDDCLPATPAQFPNLGVAGAG